MRVNDNFFIALLFISLFIEASFISFPFVFLFSLLFYIVRPETRTVITVIFFGILIDIMNVAIIGLTPLSLLIVFLFIEAYRKAFDFKDWRILLSILILSSFFYANFFSYTNNILLFLSIFLFAYLAIKFSIQRKSIL